MWHLDHQMSLPEVRGAALGQHTRLWEASGWRGERLNAQVLIWSTLAQEQVRFETSTLESKDGRALAKGQVKASLVRYVLSDLPYGRKALVVM